MDILYIVFQPTPKLLITCEKIVATIKRDKAGLVRDKFSRYQSGSV